MVAAQAPEQGMPVTAVMITRMITLFWPRFVGMCGIAAALDDTLHFGDVIAAEQTWDYTTGKLVSDGAGQAQTLPENRAIRTDALIVEQMRRLSQDAVFLSKLSHGWPAKKPGTELRVRTGPIASGGSVVEQEAARNSIKARDRKTIGLDMEAHAVAAACWYSPRPMPHFIVAKGVVDFGVPPKTDEWHAYASYTSAGLLAEWARH